MNKINKVLLIASLSTCIFSVNANEDKSGIYLGAGLGTVDVDSEGFDDPMGFELFGGYNFNRYFAVEAAFVDFGDATASLTSSVDAKLAADTLAVGVVGKIPLNDGFELFGKVGFHAWDVELSAPGFNSLTDDGSDIYYGIGANYNLSQKLSLGVSYNSYTLDSDDSDGSVTMLSANVTYRF